MERKEINIKKPERSKLIKDKKNKSIFEYIGDLIHKKDEQDRKRI